MDPRKHCLPVWWVSEELEKLRKFHSLMEDTLVQLEEKKRQELTRIRGEAISGADIDWLVKQDPKCSDSNNLSKKLRYSILIHLFTTIEAHGLVMCDEIAETLPVRLAPGDLKGATLERIRAYLDKVCDVFPASRGEWEKLTGSRS